MKKLMDWIFDRQVRNSEELRRRMVERDSILKDLKKAYKIGATQVIGEHDRPNTMEVSRILLREGAIQLYGGKNHFIPEDLKMRGLLGLHYDPTQTTYLYSIEERTLVRIYKGRITGRKITEYNLSQWDTFIDYIQHKG